MIWIQGKSNPATAGIFTARVWKEKDENAIENK